MVRTAVSATSRMQSLRRSTVFHVYEPDVSPVNVISEATRDVLLRDFQKIESVTLRCIRAAFAVIAWLILSHCVGFTFTVPL